MAHRFLLASGITFGLALAASSPALAQDGSADAPAGAKAPSTPEAVQKLYDCRNVPDPMQRLACYDTQVADLAQKQQSSEIVFADREQMREAKRGLFGLSLSNLRLFDGGDEEEFTEITTTIKQAVRLADGKWGLVLEDGARWVQSDETPLYRDIEPGTPITISEGALTSYKAKIGNLREVKVKRVQ